MSSTLLLMDKLRQGEQILAGLGVSSLQAAQNNQILSANSILQAAIPAWAIVDSSLGLVREILFIVLNAESIYTYNRSWNDSKPLICNIFKALPKLYGNGQLLYQGIAACNTALTGGVFIGFAIKYGIEFGIALQEWIAAEYSIRTMRSTHREKQIVEADLTRLHEARYNVINNGMFFASFLTIALGHPIGFAMLAMYLSFMLVGAGIRYFFLNEPNDLTNNKRHGTFQQKHQRKPT